MLTCKNHKQYRTKRCHSHIFTGDQACWNGWDAIQNSCFRLYDDKKTWPDAQSLCKTEKATLAKLNSEDKNYFVFLQLVKPVNPSSNAVWVGLSRDIGTTFIGPMELWWSIPTGAQAYRITVLETRRTALN